MAGEKSATTTLRWLPWFSDLQRRCTNWRFGTIDPSAKLGKRGEQAAARYLRQQRYQVLAESYRDQGGELDIVALDSRNKQAPVLVFVEVKTLASKLPGHPADRVDENKQRRITTAALRFLKRYKLLEQRVRFDVIAVWWPERSEPEPQRLEHYEHAFEATGVDSLFG